MRIIAKRRLREYWQAHPDTEQALKAWFADTEAADWKTPGDVKRAFGDASIVGNERVVFNIRGNNYRLVVAVDYEDGAVLTKWIGTHREYNAIDVETVGRIISK